MRDVAGITVDTSGLVSFYLTNNNVSDISEDIQRFCALLLTDVFMDALVQQDQKGLQNAVSTAVSKMQGVIRALSVDINSGTFKFLYVPTNTTFVVDPDA